MSTLVEKRMEPFEHFPLQEKQEAVAEIFRRGIDFDVPTLDVSFLNFKGIAW